MTALVPCNTNKIRQYFKGVDISIKIPQEIFALREEGIKIQEHLHQYPELSFKEHETSKFIINYLKQISNETNSNLRIQTNIAKTGVVATLKGKFPGSCILFRADIDALPIQESTDYKYKSKNANVSHACGHDFHITILLLTAKILCQHKHLLHGSVKFLFQPAEELGAGALQMINDKQANILQDVDECYGLHVWSTGPLGSVALNNHIVMAGLFCLHKILSDWL